MPSLQSRLLIFVMRNRHLLRLHLKRDTWDWNTSISDFRRQCEAGSRRMKLPDGIEVSPVKIEGVTGIQNRQAEWLIPDGATKDKVSLYTIGGGYVSGSCNDHRAMIAKITKGSSVRTLLFDHRLAPEDPFPAALDDAVTAYRWLLAQGISPSNIMIAGDSAGGGLCLATLLALRDQGIPLPFAAVALSPWTDLALTGESYRTKLKASIDPPGMSVVCSKYYVGENDPCLSWISPLYGDLRGLPPIFICVGTNETMLDDSTRFAEKAKAAGVDVTLRVWEGIEHLLLRQHCLLQLRLKNHPLHCSPATWAIFQRNAVPCRCLKIARHTVSGRSIYAWPSSKPAAHSLRPIPFSIWRAALESQP